MLHNHVNQPDRGAEELVEHGLQQRTHVHLVHNRRELDAQAVQRLLQAVRLLAEHLRVQLVERLEDEVDEGAISLWVSGLARELACLGVVIYVAPETVGECGYVKWTCAYPSIRGP